MQVIQGEHVRQFIVLIQLYIIKQKDISPKDLFVLTLQLFFLFDPLYHIPYICFIMLQKVTHLTPTVG